MKGYRIVFVIGFLFIAIVSIARQESRLYSFFFLTQPIILVIASELSLRLVPLRHEGEKIGVLLGIYVGVSALIAGLLCVFFLAPPITKPAFIPTMRVVVVPTIYPTPTPMPTRIPSVRLVKGTRSCLGQCRGDAINTSYANQHTCIGMDDLCYRCEDGRFFVVSTSLCQ